MLDYLGRYTHRVAIANHRIVDASNGKVSFRYRDRKDDDTLKVMTVSANEFIRRFMLHVLPDGYMRIRHFGFLANRWKKKYLGMCRQLLGIPPLESETCQKTSRDLMLELTGIDVTQCPLCKKGQMIKIGELPKFSGGSFTVSLK